MVRFASVNSFGIRRSQNNFDSVTVVQAKDNEGLNEKHSSAIGQVGIDWKSVQ